MAEWVYVWESPFGWAALAGSSKGVARLDFGYSSRRQCLEKARIFPDVSLKMALKTSRIKKSGKSGSELLLPRYAAGLINRYFEGEKVVFDFSLDWSTFTPFQKAVWRGAMKIPYGETRSYAWVAARAGAPRGARAAGSALGANPLPVIVPCHRVVRADGALGGFGMGLPMKKKLLALERAGSSK